MRVRSRHLLVILVTFILTLAYLALPGAQDAPRQALVDFEPTAWTRRVIQNPVGKYQKLPYGNERRLPAIQAIFGPRTPGQRKVDAIRVQAIKDAFNHTWQGYRKHAWLADELQPISGGNRTTFGNWSLTLIDSLDTLWIMGFKEEFQEAVEAVAKIDFSAPSKPLLSVFETTIRFLGGLLSAYDLSGEEVLLKKAFELGEFLYGAFDTPNRLPVAEYDWQSALNTTAQSASFRAPLADIGSLGLEFTRLSQLTGDPKYFDAVQRITDLLFRHQQKSMIPGLWPIFVNAEQGDFFTGVEFSLGTSADSAYEYIPKMNLLLAGQKPEYGMMYSRFMEPLKKHILYRPLAKDGRDVLLAGYVATSTGQASLVPSAQHLGCFVGGMVAIGAKTVGPATDLEIAEKLADGCVWLYSSTLSGIMPETLAVAPCASKEHCPWSEEEWHSAVTKQQGILQSKFPQTIIFEQALYPGITQNIDNRYLLRPEALESIFVLYRATGNIEWQDKAWKMWRAIEKATKTDIAFAQVNGVSSVKPDQVDIMESFFPGETLKYLFLTFSDPTVISLDEWVFNTEAHPFRRPENSGRWI